MKSFVLIGLLTCCAQGLRMGMVKSQEPVTFVIFNARNNELFDCWIKNFKDHSTNALVHAVPLGDDAETHAIQVTKNLLGVSVDPAYVGRVAKSSKDPSTQIALGRDPHTPVSGARWPPNIYQRLIWRVFESRLVAGHKAVIHSDLDAIWHADPWPILNEPSMADADMICASARNYPHDVGEAWHANFVINPAFLLMRNTPEMRKLVAHLNFVWDSGNAPKGLHEHSDMFMLNRYLAHEVGCNWTEPSLKVIGTTNTSIRRGHCGNLKIAVLPFGPTGLQVAHGKYKAISRYCGGKMFGPHGIYHPEEDLPVDFDYEGDLSEYKTH